MDLHGGSLSRRQATEADRVRSGSEERREAETWRGRLEGEDRRTGHEKGPTLSSGKKFEDLDNYLRGSAAAAATKRNKRKRGRRFGGDAGLEGSGGGSSVETGGSSVGYVEGREVRIRKRAKGKGWQHACPRRHGGQHGLKRG